MNKNYYLTSENCVVGGGWDDVVKAESESEAVELVMREREATSADVDAYMDEKGDIYIWTRGFAKDMPYMRVTKEMISVLAAWAGIPNAKFCEIVKQSVKRKVSPMVKQFLNLKTKHPDALLLFRCGDFYETYKEDAVEAARILGITLTKSSKTKDDEGEPLKMAGFPHHALDTYLPKLIRNGKRVAICDAIENI